MPGGSERLRGLLLALLVLLLAAPAAGQVYRCQGADGSTLYTGDPRQCPGAAPHQSPGRVHAIEGAGGQPSREAPAAAAAADDGAEATWRSRKLQAEAELAHASHQLERTRRAVTLCNRGAGLWTEDEATGLRRDVSCSDVRDEAERLDAQVRELRAYLDGGLADECRRAGCLPGWIR